MSAEKDKTERKTWPPCDGPVREPRKGGDRRWNFGCCGSDRGEMTGGTSCGSFMKKHPVVASTILVAMGVIFITVPAGAILGIIAFFRTF